MSLIELLVVTLAFLISAFLGRFAYRYIGLWAFTPSGFFALVIVTVYLIDLWHRWSPLLTRMKKWLKHSSKETM